MSIHEVYIYLRAKNAEKAIAFYKDVFGATEKFRLVEPGGRIGHIELSLGNTVIMLSSEFPEFGIHAPEPDAPKGFSIHLHVEDADALIAKSAAAGATVIREATDQFYGERSGTIRDPFGFDWIIGHSIEEVAPEEMQRRYNEMGG
ncbi:VOC family protein [Sneathiella sp. CAU 1612]|uniref:VOC family protein n=1 Tax=Sneathiella sedimenti TaxID=2816034 RepID=A0ABS3F955_9PROT|nr:VOC family protein [Sneathiella sedimenti]MBO0334914.1 VOC family protein [Sneathiella sedimenti]